jgi:hypothetical protein
MRANCCLLAFTRYHAIVHRREELIAAREVDMPRHASIVLALVLLAAGAGQALAKGCPPHSHQILGGAGCFCDTGYTKNVAGACVWAGGKK